MLFHIRQLRSICRSLTIHSCHALVRAMVLSTLNYSNRFLSGALKYLLGQLSGVMRAATCLVLVLPRRSHIIDAISDCGGSTFPHESSSNSVCWFFGVSTGLHSAPPYLTDYFILVVAKDGQVYDQRLLAAGCSTHQDCDNQPTDIRS